MASVTAGKISKISRFLPAFGAVLVAGLTLASGVIQGRMSNRWGVPPDMLAAAKKLEEFPSHFGNWQLQSSEELSKDVVTQVECVGYFVREYLNQQSGETVKVAVLLGPSGPISVHTPEICFSSRDYEAQGERQRVTILAAHGENDELWAVTFRANNVQGERLRVCYGWSAGGHWAASEDPRFAFADRPFLYKIQLASSLPPDADLETHDPCREFLADFVPVASNYLAKAS